MLHEIFVPWRAALACLAVCAAEGSAVAQQSVVSTGGGVRPATFEEIAGGKKLAKVQFGRVIARVGDQVIQKLELELRLTTSLRQGKQIIEKHQSTVRNSQHRRVTTTAVESGRTAAVEVNYVEALKELVVNDDSRIGQPYGVAPSPQARGPQCVHGKTYMCRREPGEDGKLVVMGANGQTPPQDELGIVAQNMEMVGRGNPLAEFLAGRTMAIGEKLSMPREAAQRLINLGDEYGAISQFDLTLRKTAIADGANCADFKVSIEAISSDSSQARLQLEGPLVVQLDTCRAVYSNFTGPLALTETRGSYGVAHQLIGTGRMSMRISSEYSAVPR